MTAYALLADGRFPSGGHVHSAGIEAAIADGRVRDLDDLEAFLIGRIELSGRVDAALVVASAARLAVGGLAAVELLDAEVGARLLAAPLREASRRTGRQLVRAAGACWPSALLAELAALDPPPHHTVALAAVGLAAGLHWLDLARLSLHHAVQTPAQATIRLVGLDPFAVTALVANLGDRCETVARECVLLVDAPLRDLPAGTGPVVDSAAVRHAAAELTLFVT
jgi:urease accessory protein